MTQRESIRGILTDKVQSVTHNSPPYPLHKPPSNCVHLLLVEGLDLTENARILDEGSGQKLGFWVTQFTAWAKCNLQLHKETEESSNSVK